MNWLLHNPIADMPGPSFLGFYGCVVVATLLWCWWRARKLDPTGEMPPMPLPAEPDPLEVAYLKGGANETTRVTVFDLIQRGYLEIHEPSRALGLFKREKQIRRAAKALDPRLLSPVERTVYAGFSTPQTAAEVFRSSGLPGCVEAVCQKYQEGLQAENLLFPEEQRNKVYLLSGRGALVMLGLAGYKLFVALEKGRHNVAFLIIMAVLSCLLLAVVCRPPRQSKRGRDYLARLESVFERLKAQAYWTTGPQADALLLMSVALFGMSALENTLYADVGNLFRGGNVMGGGGCGGGGCGGGGCGGGGCGGGGCGGCGG
jgi:uncharacterized protein (TIGR04222 family)